MVQRLRCYASNAGGTGSIPSQGTKMLHGAAKKKPTKQKQLFIASILHVAPT